MCNRIAFLLPSDLRPDVRRQCCDIWLVRKPKHVGILNHEPIIGSAK